jgi:hypothetical protein
MWAIALSNVSAFDLLSSHPLVNVHNAAAALRQSRPLLTIPPLPDVSINQIHALPGCPPLHVVAADHRIETALRLAVYHGHKALIAKCRLGGGVQGDYASLAIAVSRKDVNVLLLLLQAAHNAVPWKSQEALQLPLARLLTLFTPSDDDDDRAQFKQAAVTADSHWASSEVSPQECSLLDQIAQGCLYSRQQLQRAMTTAAAAGLSEVSRPFLRNDQISEHRCRCSSCC